MLAAVLAVAMLYGSVGHGGGTGFFAILTLFSHKPADVAPAVLAMNIVVSGSAFYHFHKAGKFRWRIAVPFLVTSIPAAYIGGTMKVNNATLSWILAISLGASAVALLRQLKRSGDVENKPISLFLSLPTGAVIGLVSGMLGIGGGVFLSPVLVLMQWATVPESAAVAAGFILLNSIAGLSARLVTGAHMPMLAFSLVPVALIGGFLGSRWGALRSSPRTLRILLAIVLFIAAIKSVIDGVGR